MSHIVTSYTVNAAGVMTENPAPSESKV
jgi:hypothetical protein